jgi:phosphatidylserine/phosphatidylglycerophosphate/cardiolipin synthase-like enzyme
MKGIPALLLVLLLTVAPQTVPATAVTDADTDTDATAVVISGIHPGGGPDWEHVVLSNPGTLAINVSKWSLGDGEGRLVLPEGTSLPPRASFHVALNASGHEVLWACPPDVLAARVGGFGLADQGDGLELLDVDGRVVDQVWYGEPKGPPPTGWSGDPIPTPARMPWGRVLLRRQGADTGTAADWTRWTEPRCGWLDPRSLPVPARGNVSTFVTPEGGWNALAPLLASAEKRITAALYGLTSSDLAAIMAQRARMGVDIRLLVEEDVVGMSDASRSWRDGLLSALEASGAQVFTTIAMEDRVRHRPYRYHHEKCCVVDGRTFLVSTENWGPSSFRPSPERGAFASRGWGAVVDCGTLALELEGLIERDIELSGQRWNASATRTANLPTPANRSAQEPPRRPARVGLLIGPEGWGDDLSAIVDLLGDALETIDLELADLDVHWDGKLSPLVEALLDAAVRGVRVRLLLDPGFGGEGVLALDELHRLAAGSDARGLRGVLAADIPGVERVHAKGAIIDGNRALFGSMNWARSSIARNREVNVVIEGAGAIAPLVEVFESDWCASTSVGGLRIPEDLITILLKDWSPPDDSNGLPPPPGDMEGFERSVGRDGFDWAPVLRTALVLGGGIGAWWVERRYCVRANLRLGCKRLSRFMRSGLTPRAGGRDDPRTTCPGQGPGKGSPPGEPRQGPRTVRILVEGDDGEAGS